MGRNDNGGERAGYWSAVSALSAPIIKRLILPNISRAVMGPVQLSTLSYRQDLAHWGWGSGWRQRKRREGGQWGGEIDRMREEVIETGAAGE